MINDILYLVMMIVIITISIYKIIQKKLFDWDKKNRIITNFCNYSILIVLGVLSLYHIFDFVFRNIFLEKSVGSSYFKLQTFSVITLLFDFGMPIFILFRFIFLKTINKENKYLSFVNQQIIIYILGFLQSFKYIRFIKVYLMINKLAREIEKKQKYKEAIIESKKKAQKGNKSIVMPNNQQRLSTGLLLMRFFLLLQHLLRSPRLSGLVCNNQQ